MQQFCLDSIMFIGINMDRLTVNEGVLVTANLQLAMLN